MNDSKIKELLDLGFAVEELLRSLAEGVNIFKLPGELATVMSFINKSKEALADAPQALEEYLNLSHEDAEELKGYVAVHYGTSPDKVDHAIESILDVLISVHEVFGVIGPLIKPKH